MRDDPSTDHPSPTLELLIDLIKRPSVTPDDQGCQALIAERLAAHGFVIEHLPFGEVQNLWARRGDAEPLVAMAGHTDVVPTGDPEQWRYPPFSATLADGKLYGRGAADMKGSVAAMVTALERFSARHDASESSIAILLTSDEEGPAFDGTARVMETLGERGIHIDRCLLGEPSSSKTLGDTIRNGRRGSLGARLVIKGIQGHVAYPALADNPVHRSLAALDELCRHEWDQGTADFPPTTLQISNAHAGTGASNVIPGEFVVEFNLRYSPACTPEGIQDHILALLERHGLEFEIDWRDSARPFITERGALVDTVCRIIEDETGSRPEVNTAGGTSDGRFIAPTGTELVEFGPNNATIHQIDECIAIDELEALTGLYERMLEALTARP